MAKIVISFLQMDRDGVVNPGIDVFCFQFFEGFVSVVQPGLRQGPLNSLSKKKL